MSDAQKRKNYFDLKRDETFAMNEYMQSPVSDRDLKSNPPVKEIDIPKKKMGSVFTKKDKPSIMELPTNAFEKSDLSKLLKNKDIKRQKRNEISRMPVHQGTRRPPKKKQIAI